MTNAARARMLRYSGAAQRARNVRDAIIRRAPWISPRNRRAYRFYRQWIGPDDLCFDIGAHRGERTRLFLALGARVVALEPQATCAADLRQTFRQQETVTIVQKAVMASSGRMTLNICEEATTLSTFAEHWKSRGRFADAYAWTATQDVETVTLDTLVRQYGVPAFCKIDVEGSERSVFQGLSRPLPLISFEFTREFISDAHACVDRLSSLGMTSFQCVLGESFRFLLPEWVDSIRLFRALDAVDDQWFWGDIYARVSSSLPTP